MSIRAALLTEIISPYRVPVFNALAAWPGIDLSVLFLARTEMRRHWTVPQERIRFPYRVLRGLRIASVNQADSLFLNPGIIPRLLLAAPDVLICGGWHQPTMWLAMLWARVRRIPYVVWSESTANDVRTPRAAREAWKRRVVSGAAGFIVPGTPHREYIESLGASPERIWLAPNAVDNELFAQPRAADAEKVRRIRSDPRPVVLFVGRLTDEKGLPELLHAAARLPEARFLIVGRGPRADVYARLASVNVTFVGSRDQDELPACYAAADLLVLPTRGEPWGLVINEAMAAGLPIITSDGAGAAVHLVRPAVNGLVFPRGDRDALLDTLRVLVHDADLRARMGAQSRAIIQSFTPRTMAAGFAQAIAAVAEARDGGARRAAATLAAGKS